MNRILTLQIEIIDHVKAGWIWRSHEGKPTDSGINVQVIQEGPIPEQVEDDD